MADTPRDSAQHRPETTDGDTLHTTSPEAAKREPADLSTAIVPTTTLQHYLAEVRRYPFLSKEEELRLFEEYRGRDSREAAVALILANLRVSVAIAAE